MSNYGMITGLDVFDLHFYDGYNGDEPIFSIETMKSISISRDFETYNNILYIEDVLVDIKLMKMILGGEIDGKEFRIDGKSKWRDSDGNDSDVYLHIDVAKIIDYKFTGQYDKNRVSMAFELPLWNNGHGKNLSIIIDGEDGWVRIKEEDKA